jgi:hypothetical protein
MCLSPDLPRPRHGRLLVEALVALVLAAGTVAGSLTVAGHALAMSDAAVQFDLAARSAHQRTAEALRAPCRLIGGPRRLDWTARHRSEWLTTAGPIADVQLIDRWRTVGVGRHDSVTVQARIGVRCE